ncbi:MAG TPA: universal stress protein [Streptosporangiaceae bacterium]|nr:universal stress protein [Streptosporangiaceae bacterium]
MRSKVSGSYGVVVGYDGSPDSCSAMKWAAKEATARGTLLTVCVAGVPDTGETESMLRTAQAAARELAGDRVRSLPLTGSAARVLCDLSSDADMVVLGARGGDRDLMPAVPLGSVSLRVAAHGLGRIVVVRGHWQPVPGMAKRPVVVGADGSRESLAAMTFAAEEAVLRQSPLIAVCGLADSAGVLGAAGCIRREFEDQVARCKLGNPDLTVRCELSEGPPRQALLEAAAGAQLLVVGARGRGGIDQMTIGSVGLAALTYARCPVGVIHAR